MGVTNFMKVYSMLGDIINIINKRLEDGPTNREQLEKRGIRD